MRFFCSLMIVLFMPLTARGAEVSASDLTTCAVYHRMLAAALRRDRNLPVIAEIEEEKMNRLIRRAKTVGAEENGVEFGEELFNDDWQAALADMTDQINRNYKNVGRLKVRYRSRCAALSNQEE